MFLFFSLIAVVSCIHQVYKACTKMIIMNLLRDKKKIEEFVNLKTKQYTSANILAISISCVCKTKWLIALSYFPFSISIDFDIWNKFILTALFAHKKPFIESYHDGFFFFVKWMPYLLHASIKLPISSFSLSIEIYLFIEGFFCFFLLFFTTDYRFIQYKCEKISILYICL